MFTVEPAWLHGVHVCMHVRLSEAYSYDWYADGPVRRRSDAMNTFTGKYATRGQRSERGRSNDSCA